MSLQADVSDVAESYDTVRWSFNEETGIGTITLNRPDKLNALSTELKDEFVTGLDAYDELDRRSLYERDEGVAVRAVVVSGSGDRAFCVGSDVEEFEDVVPGYDDQHEIYERLADFPAPTIAKVDGYCVGGGLELALACDFRLASERSEVGLPEVELGILPGDGGTQRLPELVSPSRTKELAMTADHVDAEQAATEGAFNYIHPAEELDDEVQAFAERIASQPPLAVRTVKDAVDTSLETNLRTGRYYERRVTLTLNETEDHEEGVAAFEERREPEFEGK